jgi:ribonuclease J
LFNNIARLIVHATRNLTYQYIVDDASVRIDVYGGRILYSGDFRTYGRKSTLPRRLMRLPPSNIDVLMEGTSLGSDKSCVTENHLEDAFVQLLRSTTGRVFVAWSAQKW